jgi:hypothetical protein
MMKADFLWLTMIINVGKTKRNHPCGNGKHATYKTGDDWGMVYDCFTHMGYLVANQRRIVIK